MRDCDKKEGIVGNWNIWGNMVNILLVFVIVFLIWIVIIGVDDSCFLEYVFNCEYNLFWFLNEEVIFFGVGLINDK